jgi:fatty acid desaturase
MLPVDIVGWSAASLMVATFSCQNPLWMRRLAVCTNLAFISYACLAALAPVLALHVLLLPINVWRCWQCMTCHQQANQFKFRTRQLADVPHTTAGPGKSAGSQRHRKRRLYESGF